jgi:Rieske Fe-S protein
MAGGLAAGYGTFAHVAGRFLYPAAPRAKAWMFVADLGHFAAGTSMKYRTPDGARVLITRRAAGEDVSAFKALGSTCPHLGCQVHWEPQAQRFFCPCHNGAFDTEGLAISGPPKEANQTLPSFPLKVDKGLLYIEVPAASGEEV